MAKTGLSEHWEASGSPLALVDALRGYQADVRGPWSLVILDALESRIRRAAYRLSQHRGLADSEDLRQQLALEVLEAARHLRLDAEEWIPRMLMERATRAVRRWSRRQMRIVTVQLDESAIPTISPKEDGSCLLALWLEGAGVPSRDSELLLRRWVRGESLASIAEDCGITNAAAKSRSARARRRLGDLAAASGGRRLARTMADAGSTRTEAAK